MKTFKLFLYVLILLSAGTTSINGQSITVTGGGTYVLSAYETTHNCRVCKIFCVNGF